MKRYRDNKGTLATIESQKNDKVVLTIYRDSSCRVKTVVPFETQEEALQALNLKGNDWKVQK